MRDSFAVLLATLLGSAGLAHADVTDPFFGARAVAMGGAHRALGTSNDTILLNPAGMSLLRRYSVDVDYGFEGRDSLSRIHVSALDSKTGPVAASMAYTYVRDEGGPVGANLHQFASATSYALNPSVALGFNLKHARGDYTPRDAEKREVSMFTSDLGLLMTLGEGVRAGATYHNFVRADAAGLARPSVGVGLAWGWDQLSLAGDLDIDLRASQRGELSYFAGAEYFVGGQFPLRAGYAARRYEDTSGASAFENLVSGGAGWIQQGGALEVGYQQSLTRQRNWQIVGALKFFL